MPLTAGGANGLGKLLLAKGDWAVLAAADKGVLVMEGVEAEPSKAGTGGNCTRKSGTLILTLPFVASSLVRDALESIDSRGGASAIEISVECSTVGICGLPPASAAGDVRGNVCSLVGESRSILTIAETTDVGEASTTLFRRSISFVRSRCLFPNSFFASDTTLFLGFGV